MGTLLYTMDRSELMELYKLGHAEYRAEVSLGWERQKLFLTLNPTLLAIVGALGAQEPHAAQAALAAAAAVSVAGMFVVVRSHGRYRATRAQLDVLAGELSVPGLETTGGMRQAQGKPRAEGFRVVTVVVTVLALFVLLDLILVVLWLR